MDGNYEQLKLENQLCFPLYACAKEIIRQYKPFLDPLDLTYTQYITMMVLWEQREISVKELGDKLFLDSGTMTPLLKKLESKGYIIRSRNAADERSVTVALTAEGLGLRDKAADVPKCVSSCVRMKPEEAFELYTLLYKFLNGLKAGST